MTRPVRALRLWFSQGWPSGDQMNPAGWRDCFVQAQLGIRSLYAFQALVALFILPNWENLLSREGFVPLWPVAWMESTPEIASRSLILALFFLGSLVAAIHPVPRWIRALAFLGLFAYMAWHNSFGKIGHGLHVLLFIQFLLVWLPVGWNRHPAQTKRPVHLATLFLFWCAQGVPLLAYSMAGLIKLGCGVYQLAAGQASVFGPEALPRHIADRLIQTGESAPLAHWVIEFPWLFMPMMWVTLYLEFFAFWALFQPAIRKMFVVGLIAFHLGSFLTMGILFAHNMFLLILLFLVFPACRCGNPGLKATAKQLPLVGRIFKRI